MVKSVQNMRALNINAIEEQLNQIIFEYIDTSESWQKASTELSEIERELEQFFIKYIDENNGSLPKGNAYWYLFMDVVSKLLYFKGVANAKLNKDNEKEMSKVIEAWKASLLILPNNQIENNREFLEEIIKSIQALSNETVNVEETTIEKNLKTYNQYLETKY